MVVWCQVCGWQIEKPKCVSKVKNRNHHQTFLGRIFSPMADTGGSGDLDLIAKVDIVNALADDSEDAVVTAAVSDSSPKAPYCPHCLVDPVVKASDESLAGNSDSLEVVGKPSCNRKLPKFTMCQARACVGCHPSPPIDVFCVVLARPCCARGCADQTTQHAGRLLARCPRVRVQNPARVHPALPPWVFKVYFAACWPRVHRRL